MQPRTWQFLSNVTHIEKPSTTRRLAIAKIDLKDTYFSIPIHPDDKKYWRFPLGNSIYQFTCLPFGLALAPWVFTKTLRPIAALARELGMQVVFYIDDILLMAESKGKLHDQATGLVNLLQCLGFTINMEILCWNHPRP